MSALARWASKLDGLALPPEILAAAPSSPFTFDVRLFARRADALSNVDTPSRTRALEALPAGGTVLDVGCGAGAAAFALLARAGRVIGVDGQQDMLAAFAERAEAAGVASQQILGRWPDVEGKAPAADVVVCHHVLYNVGDLMPFIQALTSHARFRVVVELTAAHPLRWLHPLWRELHGLERPDGPTAQDALEALGEMGLTVHSERWIAPATRQEPHQLLAFVRERLCLPASRNAELQAALERFPPPDHRELVTLFWP